MEHETPEVTVTEEEIVINEKALKHYDDKNEATVVGTLVKKRELDSFSILTVITTSGRNRDINSLVNVRVPKDISLDSIAEKTRIQVKGKLRCRPVLKNGDNARPVYEAYIQATSVEPAKSAMEEAFGIKGRSFGESYNQIMLTGTVCRMTQTNRNTIRLAIAIRESGEKERIIEALFYARNNMRKVLPLVMAGNKICAIAEIQNYKKDPGKSYTVNGKTVVRKENVDPAPGEPIYVKNVVLLDVNEV